MSSRAMINLALDTLVAVCGGCEHDALNELINAIRDGRPGTRGTWHCADGIGERHQPGGVMATSLHRRRDDGEHGERSYWL